MAPPAPYSASRSGTMVPPRAEVPVKVKNRAALLELFFLHGDFSGIFVTGRPVLDTGAEVALVIHVVDDGTRVRIKGRVRWLRHSRMGGHPQGMGVMFSATELSARDLLIDYAQGQTLHLIERDVTRQPSALRVTWRSGKHRGRGQALDLSRRGARITTAQTLPLGAAVTVRMHRGPFRLPLRIEGTVRWNAADDRDGVGIEFRIPRDRTRAQLDRIVQKLES